MADGDGGLKSLHGHGLNRQREVRIQEPQGLAVAQTIWPTGPRGLVIGLLKHLHRHGKVRLREQFSRTIAPFGLCRRSACRVNEHVGVAEAQGCYPRDFTSSLAAGD